MSTPTTIRVVAANGRGDFIGYDSADDEYCIFSLDDTHEISAGDRLVGGFHGHSASTFAAQNLTRRDSPWIDLSDWELPLVTAVERLVAIEPTAQFIVLDEVFMPHSDDIVRQLVDEIRRRI